MCRASLRDHSTDDESNYKEQVSISIEEVVLLYYNH